MVHTRRHTLTKRGAVLACLGAALVAGAVGQPRPQKKASTAEVRKHVDPVWFRQSLVEDNLAHWLAAAPTPNGFFQVSLDRQWKPYAKQVGTLVRALTWRGRLPLVEVCPLFPTQIEG